MAHFWHLPRTALCRHFLNRLIVFENLLYESPYQKQMSAPAIAERSGKELVILDAATKVFLAHGFSAATTDMIQRAAGVSKATMYSCFANKETMFAAVIERECWAMTQGIRSIRSEPGNITCTLTELGLSYLRLVLSPPALALFRVVVAEAPRFPALSRRFYLAGPHLVTSLVVECLHEAAQSGEVDVRAVGIEAAASMFVSLLRAEGQLQCLTHPDATPSSDQMNQWVQLAVTTFLRAFGVSPEAAL